jgi:peptide/nickel transport system substrate-binding protein
MGREPGSLFLYGDSSSAARSIREAIYDGPVDLLGYQVLPVILEKIPAPADGDVLFEPAQVAPGATIVDEGGNLVALKEGVRYLPSGCREASCAQTYAGQEPAAMDVQVARFKLLPGLTWSDGAPLTAQDSVYSYEVARSLYPRARARLLDRTQSYTALDELSLEWRGIPGASEAGYRTIFFTPLPRHTWEATPPQDLLTAEPVTRRPLGWGPYVIDEWTAGDHITLSKNPAYFRAAEGLPAFDQLVFRFVPDRAAALEALLSGECDFADETAGLEGSLAEALELQETGRLALDIETAGWEHADFGITSSDPSRPALVASKAVRQALAACIDREKIAAELFLGRSSVPDTYLPPAHPLANPEIRRYPFNPQEASAALQAAGWVDADNNPATPRQAQGIPGVPDGTPFTLTWITSDEPEKQRAAGLVQEALAQCGVQVNAGAGPAETQFAPGPDGPVFGRKFDLAQYAWMTGFEPPCFLYTTSEIPGPYPEFPKGWGGANASGFSNPEYDQACLRAQAALPGTPEYEAAQRQAQAIFAEELPAIPLYWRLKLAAYRPDLCGVQADPSAENALWNLERFSLGEGCEP